jgi:hypothetical protein
MTCGDEFLTSGEQSTIKRRTGGKQETNKRPKGGAVGGAVESDLCGRHDHW